MSFAHDILSHPDTPRSVKQSAVERIRSDPGIPSVDPRPTSSFWLSDVHPQFKHPSSKPLPQSASIVIIGSGITGTSVARQLILSKGLGSSSSASDQIVLLDARQICNGATGRNGGHCNETGFDEYVPLREKYGEEVAMKITRFRPDHLEALQEVVKEDGIEELCQFREVESMVVYQGAQVWEEAKERLGEFKKAFGNRVQAWRSIEDKKEIRAHGIHSAIGLIVGKAGAIWPYKFVTTVRSKLTQIDPNFHIFPETPVEKMGTDTDGRFIVSTPRGDISATHVVHCTNAHVTHLVPGLRDHIYPLRGHMSAQTPPSAFPNQSHKRSWLFYQDSGLDYLTQLPHHYPSKNPSARGSEMMCGGGWSQAKYFGIEELGVSTDSEVRPEFTEYFSAALNKAFLGEVKAEDGFKVKSVWTGNMGFSADSLPWVGKLPPLMTGRENRHLGSKLDGGAGAEWISAAYSGEGMVNAWLCGKALALMILGRIEEIEEWFPEQMGISEERMKESTMEKYLRFERFQKL